MAHPVLWQFRPSHYSEKARWALDWKGVPYERRTLLPGLHLPRVWWMTRQKLLPVLQVDGDAVADSTCIIAALERRWPEPPLYPPEHRDRQRALELEEVCDTELGPHVRRALFHELLDDAAFVGALFAGGESRAMQSVFRTAFPLLRAAMRADMAIDAAGAARSRDRVAAALDRLAPAIGPAGHLVGDRFTVADLAAAALLSPLVMPPEFPYPWPDGLPAGAARWRDSLAGHPVLRWAAETYRRHRGTSHAVT